MAAALSAASIIVSATLRLSLWRGWALFAGGGVVMLAGAVFLFGPGTIFPIVIAAGTVLIAVSALAGAVAGRWLS
jgi:hypothetical protein